MTFKEGNLTTLWEEVRELLPFQQQNQHQEQIIKPEQGTEERYYRWVTGLTYQGYSRVKLNPELWNRLKGREIS